MLIMKQNCHSQALCYIRVLLYIYILYSITWQALLEEPTGKRPMGRPKKHLGEECSSRDGEERIQMVPTYQMVQYLYQLKRLAQ